ncbi:MAG: hypothetical protein M1142_03030 [Patescibacteria group bacterium]|nr:hypothetical protein [Patescibacteria group bacterium]
MKKVTIVALSAAVMSFLATVGIAGAQTASPSPTESPSPMPTASPRTTVPSGAPATGYGGY